MITLIRIPLTAILLAALAAGQTAQKNDPLILGSVSAVLEQLHLADKKIDDAVSRIAFDAFIDSLDPLKLYFDQSDIELLGKRRDDIDDMVKRGSARFAYRVFDLFKKRVQQRVGWVEEILGEKLDFSVKESFITDKDLARYARSARDGKARWRRRIKSNLLSYKVDEVEDEVARERLLKRYRRFERDITRESKDEVLQRFVNAVTTVFDPHTIYMSPKSFEDFNMNLNLNYQGIGALLGEDDDGYITINRVIPGGAVEKQGKIKARDRIVAVAQGDEGEFVEIVGLRPSDAVKLIRGKGGTTVRLKIMPAKGGGTVIHTLIRQKIELADNGATSKVMSLGEGEAGFKVGVIDLPNFYRDADAAHAGKKVFRSSTRDIEKMLDGYKKDGVDAVVLDLRRNGGGYLPEAVDVAGLFIEGGCVVQVKGARRSVRQLSDRDKTAAWSGPVIVLVSRGSASASEIVAGAIKDYRRGLVIGDSTTHGKGTVQTPIDLADALEIGDGPGSLGVVKTTIQKFYRPNGESTQLRGVASDVTIPSFTEAMDIGERELPHALAFDRIRPVEHQDYALVDGKLVKRLAELSAARRAESAYFKTLTTQIAAYVKMRERKAIPLEEKAYLDLQKELDAGNDALDAATGERKDADPWLDEVIAITADYVAALKRKA